MRRFVLACLAPLSVLAAAPTVAQTPPADFVTVERQPEKTGGSDPVYPDSLRAAGIEGRVVLRAWITKTGTVKEVQVLRTDHQGFNANAVAAVRTWTFRPAEKDGQPVDVWLTIPIRFRQREAPPSGKPSSPPTDVSDTAETKIQELAREIPDAQCAALPPLRIRMDRDSLRHVGAEAPLKMLLASLCIGTDRATIAGVDFADGRVPTPEEAQAAGQRMGEQAGRRLLLQHATECATAPVRRILLRGNKALIDGQPPSAEHFGFLACLGTEQTRVLGGVDFDPDVPPGDAQAAFKALGEDVMVAYLRAQFVR